MLLSAQVFSNTAFWTRGSTTKKSWEDSWTGQPDKAVVQKSLLVKFYFIFFRGGGEKTERQTGRDSASQSRLRLCRFSGRSRKGDILKAHMNESRFVLANCRRLTTNPWGASIIPKRKLRCHRSGWAEAIGALVEIASRPVF